MGAADDPQTQSARVALTRLLNDAGGGDAKAAAEVMPLLYDQLRSLARARMRSERPDQTLQATALVHEAYLRLVDREALPKWESRGHFLGAAAEAMRRILVDAARRRGRLKRGGALRRVTLDAVELTLDDLPEDLVALDDALNQLAEKHPEKARLVQLRYFAGATIEEAARVLGVSVATANRHWAYARAWLFRRVSACET